MVQLDHRTFFGHQQKRLGRFWEICKVVNKVNEDKIKEGPKMKP